MAVRASFLAALLLFGLSTGPTLGMPRAITASELLGLCQSATVADARTKGDALGWGPADAARVEGWRAAFSAQGGTVDVVVWQRGQDEKDGLLAFWVAEGPGAHRACAYSANDPGALRTALHEHLGTPLRSETSDVAMFEEWALGRHEIVFSQVGSAVSINVSIAR